MPNKKETEDKAKRGNLFRVHPLISDDHRKFLNKCQKETGDSHSLIIRKSLDLYITKFNNKKKK